MNFNENRFCGSSRTGESIRLHIEVRILPPSEAVLTVAERSANADFCKLVAGLQAPIFRHPQTEIADSLRRVLEKIPFLGDWHGRSDSIFTAAGEAVQTTQRRFIPLRRQPIWGKGSWAATMSAAWGACAAGSGETRCPYTLMVENVE
jgi:hypothetical protein